MTSSPSPQRPLKVFLSYAHENARELKQLDEHLVNLKEEKLIEAWSDREIHGGQVWNAEILRELDAADVVILLVSVDFNNSKFCRQVEMKRALERHEAKTALVIPVYVNEVESFPEEIRHLQSVPSDTLGDLCAIKKFKPQSSGYVAAAKAIREAIEAFQPQPRDLKSTAGSADTDEDVKAGLEVATKSFELSLRSLGNDACRKQVQRILGIPVDHRDEDRREDIRRLLNCDRSDKLFAKAMAQLNGLAQHKEVSDQDARAITRMQKLLTRRIFPRTVLREIMQQFRGGDMAILTSAATTVGAEVAVKTMLGVEPEFVSRLADGNSPRGAGMLHFAEPPPGDPNINQRAVEILRGLAEQLQINLDADPGDFTAADVGMVSDEQLREWAKRIHDRVWSKSLTFAMKSRPLNDFSEIEFPAYYCVLKRPPEHQRKRLHDLLTEVKREAPWLLFFELNPEADTRSDEEATLDFIDRTLPSSNPTASSPAPTPAPQPQGDQP